MGNLISRILGRSSHRRPKPVGAFVKVAVLTRQPLKAGGHFLGGKVKGEVKIPAGSFLDVFPDKFEPGKYNAVYKPPVEAPESNLADDGSALF